MMVSRLTISGNSSYRTRTVPVCDRNAVITDAISTTTPTTNHGKAFDLALRPRPNAVRSPWAYSERAAYVRPRRGPVYRWYPMSWMTPFVSAAAIAHLHGLRRRRLAGLALEQLGHAVTP